MLIKLQSLIYFFIFTLFSFFAKAEIITHPSASNERICLSIRVLEKEANRGNISNIAFSLAGIGWLDGVVVDRKNHDIILSGRVSKSWPSLTLDDFVVNLRNVMSEAQYPYCSLDPLPQNVLKLNSIMSHQVNISDRNQIELWVKQIEKAIGPQQVVIGGVPRDSHHAYIMINADYHMKKLSQGHVNIDGIPSMLDISISSLKKAMSEKKPIIMGSSMSRFWFHIKEGDPKFSMSNDAMLLDKCSVVVLTEKQRSTQDGKLYDSSENDAKAELFAKNLSYNFQNAATKTPFYAELENLYRLQVVLKVLYKYHLAKNDFNFDFFLRRYNYKYKYTMKPSLPGLVNGKIETIETKHDSYVETLTLFPLVAGGVSMELPMFDSKFQYYNSKYADSFAKNVISSRPNENSLYWKIKAQ